ncbi:hypothetical protein [Acetobacter sp.]|uniref:hypothetical protein n=1 Tax=Acetobacter sp. TaxID=440 RepID=UPI0039E99863
MANRAYSTPISTWAFHTVCTGLPALMAPALVALALVALALLGLATPDPVISGRVAHTQGVAQ